MRVFLYEWTCAQPHDHALPASLRAEGAAMLRALLEDFQAIPDLETRTLLGQGWPGVLTIDKHAYVPAGEGLDEFVALCDWADVGLVIAPEFQSTLEFMAAILNHRCQLSLNCTGPAIDLTASKRRLSQHWLAQGVPTPPVTRWPEECRDVAYPFVLKPLDGAGSLDTFLIHGRNEIPEQAFSLPMIAQQYVPGIAASVAFLIGPRGRNALLPCRQLLSDDGRFTYEGGELPLPPPLAERAVALADRAVACVPGLRSYVGVDLVLGDATDGSQDFAIEINPRLTTSYLGLRALAETNLAEAMLCVVQGEKPALKWQSGSVRFRADGI